MILNKLKNCLISEAYILTNKERKILIDEGYSLDYIRIREKLEKASWWVKETFNSNFATSKHAKKIK